jgi:hypothetical protein
VPFKAGGALRYRYRKIESRCCNLRASLERGGGSYLFRLKALSFLWLSFFHIGWLQLTAI